MVEPSKGKWRALRIPLTFHRHSDKLERWRHLMTAVAVLTAILWLVALRFTSDGGVTSYSPGPVSSAHAAWEQQCWQCHADFAPQRADAVDFGTAHGRRAKKWESAADRQCRRCHQVDGLDTRAAAAARPYSIAQHSLLEAPQAVEGCAACHREHPPNGRDGSLLDVADRRCIRCHKNLHELAGPSSGAGFTRKNEVADFDGHPPFRSLKERAGGRPIKFSHRRHLAIGLRLPEERQEKAEFKLEDIESAAIRETYRTEGQIDTQSVELDCAACHSAFSIGGSKGEGGLLAEALDERHISMPNFKQHCAACHRLDYEPGSRDPDKVIEHGLSSAQISAFLKERYDGDKAQRDPVFIKPPTPRRPLPGSPPDEGNRGGDQAAVDAAIARAESHLRNRCFQCHQPALSGDPMRIVVRDISWSEPANAPLTILRGARFSHKAHEFARIDCSACHSLQKPSTTRLAANAALTGVPLGSDITIPDVDNCLQCHGTKATGPAVPAPFNCVTCHRYHRDKEATANHPPIADDLLSNNLSLVGLAAIETSPAKMRDAPKLVGAVSCAAAGCHGGKWPGNNNVGGIGASKTSYTAWIRGDPHAGAYDALWNERSQQMIRLLSSRSLSKSDYRQFIEQRCIGCHSTAPRNDPAQGLWLADGVSCESCHGPAHQWGVQHTLKQWPPHSVERDTSAGFIDNADLSMRAGQCVKCHVGYPDTGETHFEVNHDLIAAGHPRLRFEFASYMANLPAHWNTTREKQDYPEFEAHRWSIGQKVSAGASLRQLQWRCKSAAERTAVNNHHHAVWPEFAEYACDSCHHDLESSIYLQQPGVRKRLGQMAWGTWYFPRIDETLRGEMSGLSLEAAEAAALSPKLKTTIGDFDKPLEELRAAVSRKPLPRWDDLAQWYLAAVALVAHHENHGSFAKDQAAKDEIDKALAELFQALDYPFVVSSSGKNLQSCVASQQRLNPLLSGLLQKHSGE